jgi:AbiV family abortive infection protein
MQNHSKYINLLESILKNAWDLHDSALCLLKATPLQEKSTVKVNQSTATHAQHFIYIALEELGKFFLILNQYDLKLDELDLKSLGWSIHDKKIEYLINFIKDTVSKSGKPPVWVNDIETGIKKIRSFKEGNVYIDYKAGKIINPIANRGTGTLIALVDLLVKGLRICEIILLDFKKNPTAYIKQSKTT